MNFPPTGFGPLSVYVVWKKKKNSWIRKIYYKQIETILYTILYNNIAESTISMARIVDR